ncbi:CD209 antigen-like protein 2 [Pimephales promelas]|uniref:CD209 antigen-like protein 2 n=1 Tax=Pimephales promelas TaxID=90988 RepID=UPI00195599B0|nr:CD209 antigen-like protein 2 [Pimephales promelas]
MELEDYYENANNRHFMNTTGPQRHSQDEGKARNHRGCRCLVSITVCLGILCLLIAAVILHHFQHTNCTSKQGFLWGPDGLFLSSSPMTWSESRQYCRYRGADLVIINTEEKQRHITSLVKESVWIGLAEIETEGIIKWVDNSPLKQGFWAQGEPNGGAHENCIELYPGNHPLNNWNDQRCSAKRKGICEK